MLFNTPVFLFVFLPLVLLFYYLAPKDIRIRNLILLAASLFFYAWGEPVFVFVLMLSIMFNWFMALQIEKSDGMKKRKRLFLAAGCAGNLLVIFVFKYLMFALDTVNAFFNVGLTVPHIALPIGLSFFTFQSLSYLVDIYRGICRARRNAADVGLYISIFPQLVAGPIVRYGTISQQIDGRKTDISSFSQGVERFITGLAKKVLIANNAAIAADTIFHMDTYDLSMPLAWLGVFAYTLQIYYDFSGYSDMAIGLGMMFGFRFPENFNYPYMSLSVSEFWRRWHISLGGWFRDYLYIPLGGNRSGRWRTFLNLFIVWFFTGLWHGADVRYIVWGLYFFVLICFEKLTGYEKWKAWPLRFILTFAAILVSWTFFRCESMGDSLVYISRMFGGSFETGPLFTALVSEHWCVLLAGFLFSFPVLSFCRLEKLFHEKVLLKSSFVILLFFITLCYIAKGSYSPFIYFNF